jgi:hypothetical protein
MTEICVIASRLSDKVTQFLSLGFAPFPPELIFSRTS